MVKLSLQEIIQEDINKKEEFKANKLFQRKVDKWTESNKNMLDARDTEIAFF